MEAGMKVQSMTMSASNTYSFSEMQRYFDQLLLPIIQDNPDINFIFFFPPYSILTYKAVSNNGDLADFIRMKKYIFEKFRVLPNVELYDFQIAEKVTHDLNNYMDLSHYHQKVNTWILEKIQNKDYRVSADNVDYSASKLLEQTEAYQVPDIK